MKVTRLLSCIVLLGMTVASGAGREFYVAPDGDDGHAGTLKEPLQTLAGARDAVRREIAGGMTADVVVHFAAGNYFTQAATTFDERDSGRDGYVVIYRGAPDCQTKIYGGMPVTGWEKWRGQIYRAKLGEGRRFYRLYENGRSAVMARHPNKGSGYGGGAGPVNNTTVRIPAEWADYDFIAAQVFGWMGPNWFTEMREVTGVDREKCLLTVSPGSGDRSFNARLYVRGVRELLDEPGEWCLSCSEGYVYYWPRVLPIDGQLIVAPTTERVLDVRGSAMDKPVENLCFEGMTFVGSDFCGEWRLFRESEGDGSMPPAVREGLIRMENARNIAVRFCRILGAGHSGVYLNGWAQGCTVYGCWIEDAGFAGVYMNGWGPGGGPFASAAESYVNRGHKVCNNYIFDCGQFVGHGCGIQVFQSGHNEISHNRVAKMPRYGISYKGQRYGVLPKELYGVPVTYENHLQFVHTRNNVIRHNDISNVCRDSHDYGAIEAWGVGRDNLWEANAVHDVDQAVKWNGWAHALFADDAASYHLFRKNVIYECKGGTATAGIMLKAVAQVFENNIIADCKMGRAACLAPYIEPSHDVVFRRNILLGEFPMIYGVSKETSDRSMVPGQNTFTAVSELDYNLVYPHHDDMEAYREYGWDAHSVSADPLFDMKHPDYDRHYRDYRLKPESPAFALGFEQIDMDMIGLREDFPFERRLIGRKQANERIQGEDYDRMRDLRSQGATCIFHMADGAWAKYDNVDFGRGQLKRLSVSATYNDSEAGKDAVAIDVRLDAPDGVLIGQVKNGADGCDIKKVEGVHRLFLVFRDERVQTLDWFDFE